MSKDKFILMGMDDKRSKKIAEVLGNKTSKKILDYLTDIKEASEKDISDSLNMPINTIEYNLKKLLEAGLVEKTKNFFWSKRGKKINPFLILVIFNQKKTKFHFFFSIFNFYNEILVILSYLLFFESITRISFIFCSICISVKVAIS